MWEEVTSGDLSTLGRVDATGLVATFKEIFSGAVVRPPYGGHPRVAIYGLLEGRMTRADLVICGGGSAGWLKGHRWLQGAGAGPG